MKMKMKIEKIILFPDDNIYKEVQDFYHEIVGLEYANKPSKFWVEFESEPIQICLHHNNCYKEEDINSPRRHSFVFDVEDSDDLIKKHQELIKMGYKVCESAYPDNEHRLGKLVIKESVIMLIRDPMGNNVHFSAKNKNLKK